MYCEEDYIQLSALQHYVFCPRQCALAYIELQWEENQLTALGRSIHDKVHEKITEKRDNIIQVSGLNIFSARLGLSGQTDMVEFHLSADNNSGIVFKNHSGNWIVFPVEYKRGKPKTDKSDEVQLCAQAICLEEMLETEIKKGALYYGKNRRRKQIDFNIELRQLTENTSYRIHEMFKKKQTPLAKYEDKCSSCSLKSICMPQITQNHKLAGNYIKKMINKFI